MGRSQMYLARNVELEFGEKDGEAEGTAVYVAVNHAVG